MILKLEDVRKEYPQFRLDVSLELQEGSVTGLVGQNGAGKSTTFKAVLDLIRPDAGSIEIFGKDHRSLSREDKEDIGVVLSDAGFSGYLTIRQLLSVLGAFYSRFDRADFQRQCRRFGLPENQRIREFSTGMTARLKLLVALSHQPRLLILDEPTAGLDVSARQEIVDMLREYMETDGRAILISSHIAGDLEHFCDDIYVIHQGEICLHEDMDVILDNYAVMKVGDAEYEALEKEYLLRVKRESFGYSCLTNEKQFYMENYPRIVMERGSIDEVLLMMIGGEKR